MEKPSIAAKRATFLRKYMELKPKYKFVFLDETWIFQRGSHKFCTWQDVDVRSCPIRTVNQGKRYIVLHAGGEDGFIDGLSLVFASGSKDGDYHGEMNSINFMNWWFKLLDRLYEPTVIVMDNAPYHSVQEKKITFHSKCGRSLLLYSCIQWNNINTSVVALGQSLQIHITPNTPHVSSFNSTIACTHKHVCGFIFDLFSTSQSQPGNYS